MFNPQKLLWPESKFCQQYYSMSPHHVTNLTFILASTSMPKLPLSPRPNLMLFLSKETANAIKCHQQLWCHQQKWTSSKCNPSSSCDLYIYSGKIHHLKNPSVVRLYGSKVFIGRPGTEIMAVRDPIKIPNWRSIKFLSRSYENRSRCGLVELVQCTKCMDLKRFWPFYVSKWNPGKYEWIIMKVWLSVFLSNLIDQLHFWFQVYFQPFSNRSNWLFDISKLLLEAKNFHYGFFDVLTVKIIYI